MGCATREDVDRWLVLRRIVEGSCTDADEPKHRPRSAEDLGSTVGAEPAIYFISTCSGPREVRNRTSDCDGPFGKEHGRRKCAASHLLALAAVAIALKNRGS